MRDKQIKKIKEQVVTREQVLDFEKYLLVQPGFKAGDSDLFPLKHHFAPGSYLREIFIKKGRVLISKIHRHAHHCLILKGDITIISEAGGIKRFIGPQVLFSKPGAKRIGFANEDTIFITVHPTTETDLAKIEEDVIAKSYDEIELTHHEKLEIQSDETNLNKLIEHIKNEVKL